VLLKGLLIEAKAVGFYLHSRWFYRWYKKFSPHI